MPPLLNSRIMAFIAISTPSRALVFYRDKLGLTFIADEPFALVFKTYDDTWLRLAKVVQLVPAAHTILGWVVADIHAEVKTLEDRGVVFERYPGFSHDDAGVFTFPNGDQVAWFKDPDGNTLSLTQFY